MGGFGFPSPFFDTRAECNDFADPSDLDEF
jgi:hypothetical protein